MSIAAAPPPAVAQRLSVRTIIDHAPATLMELSGQAAASQEESVSSAG